MGRRLSATVAAVVIAVAGAAAGAFDSKKSDSRKGASISTFKSAA